MDKDNGDSESDGYLPTPITPLYCALDIHTSLVVIICVHRLRTGTMERLTGVATMKFMSPTGLLKGYKVSTTRSCSFRLKPLTRSFRRSLSITQIIQIQDISQMISDGHNPLVSALLSGDKSSDHLSSKALGHPMMIPRFAVIFYFVVRLLAAGAVPTQSHCEPGWISASRKPSNCNSSYAGMKA